MIQVSVLMEEKSSLQVELQSLRERLNHCETPDVVSTITNKKLLLLQSQMEQLQEENDRCEAPRAAARQGPEGLCSSSLNHTDAPDPIHSPLC